MSERILVTLYSDFNYNEEGCKITIPLLKLLFPKVGKIIDGMSQLDSNKIRLVINGKSPNYKGELDFATQED